MSPEGTGAVSAAPEGKIDGLSLAGTSDNLSEHLDKVERFLRRFVVFKHLTQADALALFVAHTHAIDAADTTPYLHVTSPTKHSGKTRLLEVLECLVAQPWRVVSVSEAVLFRKVERDCPTLLLDEVDAIFRRGNGDQHEGLRQLLNAGHRRGAKASRVEGRNHDQLRDFSTFCAKVLCGIGDVPDTLADRSVRIELFRRTPGERVQRFRERQAEEEATPIREALEEWARAALEPLREARPRIPDELDDRACDCWEPLVAIADRAGGDWPERARKAAVALSASRAEQDQEDLAIRLLADLRGLFEPEADDPEAAPPEPQEFIESAELVAGLNKLEHAPWSELSQGRGLTTHRLGRLLKDFGPRSTREDRHGPRGYRHRDLAPVWERYLPGSGASGASGAPAETRIRAPLQSGAPFREIPGPPLAPLAPLPQDHTSAEGVGEELLPRRHHPGTC